MAKTRPGLDRIHKQSHQAAISLGTRVLDAHDDKCETCGKAGNNLYLRCAYWWQLSIAVHKARRTMQQYQSTETGDTDPLPGMD